MKKILLIILLIISLSNCDPMGSLILEIDNKTDDTLKFVFSESHPFFSLNDSLIYPPKCKKILISLNTDRALFQEMDCYYSGIKNEDIKIYISSDKKLLKDFCDFENNWTCNSTDDYEKTLIFEINEEDIE